MTRPQTRNDEDNALLGMDLGSFDPSITQRVLAAIDRSDDPHLHIDILRRALYKHAAKLQEMSALIQSQKTEIQYLKSNLPTETGMWKAMKLRMSDEAFDWGKWAVRGTLATAGVAVASWVVRMVWKGMHA